ncbi:hypothetical protein EV201_1256 [Ancylomarina subtilis]|uniref:Uncharacterized protein n=1 Tax=Ancylomarina subtilis TaxID=1639035 RepID=A0A4V2FT36_9BACT|nr:hypothetical protein [Ancylomarina subtilis]RZT96615.1 hypothetical protein EV201_1256 [Ancylomarina subtilis]
MIITIDKNEYTLPRIEDLSIDKGTQIEQIREKDNLKLKDIKRIFTILLDCPLVEINKVEERQIRLLFDNLIFFDNTAQFPVIKSFYINGREFNLIDFENMTVKEFVDLDYFLTQDVYNNYSEILNILYKPIKSKNSNSIYTNTYNRIKSFKNRTLCYSSNETATTKQIKTENQELFKEHISYFQAKIVLFCFLDWKRSIYNDYGLTREEEPTEETEEEIIVAEDNTESMSSYWGFYHILQTVSRSNIIELDVWMQRNIKELLKRIVYEEDKLAFQKK